MGPGGGAPGHAALAFLEEQVKTALEGCELVLFVVDVKDGITPLDREVATRLRESGVSVLMVVNKVGISVCWLIFGFWSCFSFSSHFEKIYCSLFSLKLFFQQ